MPAPECAVEASDDFLGYPTKKNHCIYLHILKWPEAGVKRTVKISRGGFVKGEFLDPKLLKGLKLTGVNSANGTTITLEKPETADPYSTTIKLTFRS